MKLVLASESAYRRALLDRLSIPYTPCAHQCDERALPASATLEDHALALARGKALSIVDLVPKSFIIASDQIAEIGGEVLHKPGSPANAVAQLRKLEGKTHRLLTAVVLRAPDGTTHSSLDVHHMHMRSMREEELSRYVHLEQPLDCCGSYKIEGLGITLFDSIDGNDFTAIAGLPLLALTRMLREAGFAVP